MTIGMTMRPHKGVGINTLLLKKKKKKIEINVLMYSNNNFVLNVKM